MTAAEYEDVPESTWISLLGLLSPKEYFITVDHSSIWRRHLSWAKESGSELRTHMTQRFASNMVFMSLILGAELSVLFNSSQVTTHMREDMRNSNYHKVEFWIGVSICLSVILTIFTLITTFTAWGMVSSVSDTNAHCVLRSSIGQYIAQLPSRLVVTAIYSFLLWVVMFLFVLLPGFFSYILLLVVTFLFFHTVVVFSAFGRLIIHTGAMGSKSILDPDFEKALLPSGLHNSLLIKAMDNMQKKKSVTVQYRFSRQAKYRSPTETSEKPLQVRKDSLPRQEAVLIKQTSEALSGSSFISRGSSDTSPSIEKNTRASFLEVFNTSSFSNGRISRRGGQYGSDTHNLLMEWENEQDCRKIYDAPPPADLVDSSDDDLEDKTWRYSGGTRFPRPSTLNRGHLSRKSLKRMCSAEEDGGSAGSRDTTSGSLRLHGVLSSFTRLPYIVRSQFQSDKSSEAEWGSEKQQLDEDEDCLGIQSSCPALISDEESEEEAGDEQKHLLAGSQLQNTNYSRLQNTNYSTPQMSETHPAIN